MSEFVGFIKRRGVALILLVSIIVAWAIWAIPTAPETRSTPNASVNVIAHPVIEGQAVETFEAIGTVVSIESHIVTSKIPSYVKSIHASAGTIVKAGTPIITLAAQERDFDLESLKAQLAQAIAKKDDVARILSRGEVLAKQGYISVAKITTLRTDFEVAQQAVTSIQAQMEMANSRVEDTILRAPFDGVVGIIDVQPGGYVGAGEKITTLTQSDIMKVEISLPERAVPYLKIGLPSSATPISGIKTEISGVVQEIDSEINPTSRQIRVNLKLPNENGILTQGMSVNVKIAAVVRNPALLIPEEAVIGDGMRQFVFSVNDLGIVSRKLIEIGVRTSGMVEVLQGVALNEMIVIEGHQKIRHGQKVTIVQKPNGQKDAQL